MKRMMNDDKYGCDDETKINQPAHKVFEAIISLLKSVIIGFLAVPKDGQKVKESRLNMRSMVQRV